jgi:hypothetical protein
MRNKQGGFARPDKLQIVVAVAVIAFLGWGTIEGIVLLVEHLTIGWKP